jgi:uncharacterized repeat protein (TIGR03803 family)
MKIAGGLCQNKCSLTALYGAIALMFVLSAFVPAPAQTSDQILYNFCSIKQGSICTDGRDPVGGVIRDAAGNLYGTTARGGKYDGGTVFKLDNSGKETVLYNFCSAMNCTDGKRPTTRLTQDAAGNLYGTTTYGGAYGTMLSIGARDSGTIFKIDTSGKETVLYNFCSVTSGPVACADGKNPNGLVRDSAGNLYGTTSFAGSANDGGTVLKLDNSGKATVLYTFCRNLPCTDGNGPSDLIQDAAGNLYGTTFSGGSGGDGGGTVFKIDNSGKETVLYNFCSESNCTDGQYPSSGVILDALGNLYGTTNEGGYQGCGVVFKVDGAGKETVLQNFCLDPNFKPSSIGLVPSGLIKDAAGNLYGTTKYGGTYDNGTYQSGTVFKVDSTGLTVLYSFGANSDGFAPLGGLIQDDKGNIYGTTSAGGENAGGTVFMLPNAIPPPPSYQFIPVTPCRIADTRNATGPFGGPAMTAQQTRSFNIPQSACSIPSTAAAYSLNVTVVPSQALNYLTIWPTGQPQPNVSTLNSDGRVKANAAIVPAGTSGGVSVYVSDATNVILDINGYFVPAGSTSSALSFYSLSPCRIADTRNASGPLGGPSITGSTSRAFPILSSSCNVPSTAQAYSLNVTAIPRATLNYLTTWPTGQSQPNVSTLNAPTGTVVANAAIVPAGTSGNVSVFVSDTSDVILDINGYFAPPATGGLSLYAVTPCRVVDTRPTAFIGPKTVNIQGSTCAPPTSAQAYVVNATVVPPGPLDYLTLWPDGEPQPNVSTLNALDGAVTSNMAIVPTTNGSIDAYAYNPTNLILDISSYFAP